VSLQQKLILALIRTAHVTVMLVAWMIGSPIRAGSAVPSPAAPVDCAARADMIAAETLPKMPQQHSTVRQENPDTFVSEAERHLRGGEPLLAYNAADTGLQHWPDHVRLRQLLALSLARSGDVEQANRILTRLAAEGLDDSETLGVLARTHKDLAMLARDAPGRAAHLESAYAHYERAYTASRSGGNLAAAFYTGINAATVAVLRGEIELARWIAAEIVEICRQAGCGEPDAGSDYWRAATLGEANLILGDATEAARHYAAALALSQGRFGDLSTTRRQARLLAQSLSLDHAWLENVLQIPPVMAFTGHMVDSVGRSVPRFAPALEPAARDAIRERLASIRPLAAYGSAACGADILCLEAALELGSEIHIVLPFPPAEFRRTSVDIAPGDWGTRFDRLLESAHSLTIASDFRATGSVATYEYANLMMTGLARLRAQLLDTRLTALAVWDPQGGGAGGGAASVVSAWQRRGIPVSHVDLGRLASEDRRAGVMDPDPRPETDPAPPAARHQIKSLLFADAVGYSKLSEDQIPLYVTRFLGAVAELNRRTAYRCEHVETAGDGLYMVFADPADAAHYALELNGLAAGSDWTTHGLPPGFNLRIALHCGPVYCGWDPVTESPIFTGPHTSRAARIEPITPPGQVYASSAFAAVAAAGAADGIVLRYVGRIPLAKRSGLQSLYHLQRAS